MYVSMSREYSGDGLFSKVLSLCSLLNVFSKQTKSFKVRFFVSDFDTFIRTETETERERERERERENVVRFSRRRLLMY